MHQRHFLKIQKQRHMSDIRVMLLNNALFKNLSERDQKKMSKLIYKAEMIEIHVRDKKITRINESFQDIIQAILNGPDFDDDNDDDEFDQRDN